MISYQLVAIFIVGLSFTFSDASIDCYSGYTPKLAECEAALNSIIFESDGTLQKLSKHVGTISGNCSIIVLNPYGVRIAQQEIHTELKEILDHCRPSAGGAALPPNQGTFLNIGSRGDAASAPYESDFPAGLVKCALNPSGPPILPDDCQKAYDDLATDKEGRFISKLKQNVGSIKLGHQSCIVNVFTSDGSELIVTKDTLKAQLSLVLHQCKNKDGIVHIKGGAAGKNGRTYLRVRSSNIG